MKEKIISFLVVFSLGMMAEAIVQNKTHRQFFRPWYDDGNIYVGDKVSFKEGSPYSDLYNSCKQMTLIGLQAVSNDNVAWIFMEDCLAFPQNRTLTDIVPQDVLVTAK